MKLSVSAYRAHSSAHKKILSSSYQSQLNYGSTAASSSAPPTLLSMEPIDNQSVLYARSDGGGTLRTCENILSPTSTSMSTSENPISKEDEDDSSNPPSSECKSPSQRAKPTQRWMKLRTTVQLSSAIQKKPPLKREDSFLKRFSTRQIPEAQETVEDTGSEGALPDQEKGSKSRRRYLHKRRTVVNPDENFYFHWLMLLTFCILYNLWTLIVRQSFPELQESLSRLWLICDCLSDIAFLLDIVVQLRTGYLEQGLVVYDSKKLALHYMCSKQFLLDLAALFPLDLLQLQFGPQPLLRFPRFLKVYRSVKFYYIVESRTVWPNLWRVVNLIHILLILAHWFGCFYFLLSEAEGFQGDWVYPYRPGDYATLTRKYLGSLYWSTLTLTTIGDLPTPETNVEYVFTIVSYLIGVFIFATIVGQVGNVITNRNANRLEFERLLDGAKTYMRHHKVPGGMKRRVLRWYDYSWSRGRIQGGGDINTALGLLPDKLKTELALHVNLSVLKKVTIFQECQPEFLHDLVLKMKAYIFTPGDSICRKGEVAREMFIIADGILEVLSETGKVLTTMKAGDFFGEIGILNLDGLNKRTADVRSVGYSELFSLSREDVLTAMKDYPEAQEILQTLGRKRLMEVRGVNKRRSKPSTADDSQNHQSHQIHDNRNQNSASTSVKIVEKLKSDVKGIKSVLKKSKTERCGDEPPFEVQPLNVINSSSTSSASSKKSVLKRMNHVKSRELYNVSDEKIDQKPNSSTNTPGPIGAGLPLLQRLRLLKEKQDREEREAKLNTIKSPTHTHLTSAVSPQESIKEETEAEIADTSSLSSAQKMQNIVETKQETFPMDDTNRIITTPPTTVVREIRSCSPSSSPTKSIISLIARKNSVPVSGPKVPLKVSFRDRILEFQGKTQVTDSTMESSSTSSKSVKELQEPLIPTISTKALEPSLISVFSKQPQKIIRTAAPPTPPTRKQVQMSDSTKLWQKLKLATMITSKSYPNLTSGKRFDAGVLVKPSSVTHIPESREVDFLHPPDEHYHKANISQTTAKVKTYRSIDDLSPEFNGLPFVKKLKILNERQKIEELESIIQTRSHSLDCTNTKQSTDTLQPLVRSQSDATAIYSTQHEVEISAPRTKDLPLQIPQCLCLPLSPESNETMERRQLKSILRKLNKEKVNNDALLDTDKQQQQPPVAESTDMRSLLTAPTIEGYIARRTKLVKSVTVNSTLPSPPVSANSIRRHEGGNFFQFSPNEAKFPADKNGKRKDTEQSLLFKQNFPFMRDKGADGKLEIQQVSPTSQEYLNEITLAIKNVIHVHMLEIQTKLQNRIASLELEVSKRDNVINRLHKRIKTLEKESQQFCLRCGNPNILQQSSENTESSAELLFMREDSVDTIFAVPSSSPVSHVKKRVKLKSGRKIQSRHHRSSRIKSCSELTIPENYDVECLRRPRSYQEVVISDVTGNITNLSDNVILDIERGSTSSSTSIISNLNASTTDEDEDNDADQAAQSDLHCDDWEVRMLAAELDRRESHNKRARAASDSFAGLCPETASYYLRYRQKQNEVSEEDDDDNDDDDDDDFNKQIALRPRAASLDQFNSRYKNSDSVTKAISLDRHKDRL